MKAKSVLFGAAAVLLATVAGAQESTVAKLRDVVGNVLVSGPVGLTTATEAQGIGNGSRVITTANSGVVVVFENGCRVEMKENQRLDVDSTKGCAALVPAALAAAEPAIAAPLAGYLVPGLMVGGAAAGGGGSGGPPTPVSPN